MTTDLFIRTYARDLAFLVYAVKSIRERVTGFRNLVITAPHADVGRISKAIGERVIGVEPFNDDYVGQQHTKMKATDHSDADVICFWDSDTVATGPLDLQALLFSGEKPILHHVPFDGLHDGSEIWRAIVARDMGSEPGFEFMRRLPLAYHRSTLLGCVDHIERTHGLPLRTYMKRVPHRSFTEFNCLGSWAYEHERDLYEWRIDEADAAKWKAIAKQFWSWGGITAEIRADLSRYGIL